jgi:hypothetical protein
VSLPAPLITRQRVAQQAEAIRCLKRHLARRIWRILYAAEGTAPDTAPTRRETVTVGAPALMHCTG